jgi:hypothetical protein
MLRSIHELRFWKFPLAVQDRLRQSERGMAE